MTKKNRKFFKKGIMFSAVLLAIVLVSCLTAEMVFAAPLTENEFAVKMERLRNEYPDGMFWTKTNGTDSEGISKAGPNRCTNHYAYNGTCGEFAGWGWQCFGFANVLAYKTFGSYATRSSDGYNLGSGWIYNSSVSNYCAGDYIRLYGTNDGHSVFVTKVEGNTITIADCNRSDLCQIDWDMTYDKSYLDRNAVYVLRYQGNNLTGNGNTLPKLSISFNVNGGSVSPTTEYVVTTEGDHLNVRRDTSTSSDILTSIPDGTIINVLETREANGYIWGRISLENGISGWCAVNDLGRNEHNAIYNGFGVQDGVLYKGNAVYKVTAEYGGDSFALPFAADIGLSRSGFNFLGWSDAEQGGRLLEAGKELTAEGLLANSGDENKSLVLYAVWEDTQPVLEVYCLPNKTVYLTGEELDTEGLKLRLVYENGDTLIVDKGFEVGEFDSSDIGEKTVSVSYGGQTVSFKVTVEALEASVVLTPALKDNGTVLEITMSFSEEIYLRSIGITDLVYDDTKLEIVGGEWLDKDADIQNWNIKKNEGVLACGENNVVSGGVLVLRFNVREGGFEETDISFLVKATAKTEGGSDRELRLKQGSCRVEFSRVTVGDVNGDGVLNVDDAIYLLYNTMFGNEEYPVNQTCDFDKSGKVEVGDAVYLLYSVMFGTDEYPL